MAHKILVLGMLLSLHAAGFIFASLFTYKWYVDYEKDVGVFGICEYYNASFIEQKLFFTNSNSNMDTNAVMLKINYRNDSLIHSLANASNQTRLAISDEAQRLNKEELTRKLLKNNFLARSPISTSTKLSTIKLKKRDVDFNETLNENSTSLATNVSKTNATFRQATEITHLNEDTYSILTYPKSFHKCFQLLWPDTREAIQYLSEKPVYLTALMSVAITSASLSVLTFSWAFLCVVLRKVGAHPRASELLLVLSILTTCSTITTFGLFMGKDNRLYPFRFFGMSFWFSVGASCGFFLASILFAVNRVNIGFKYMLRSYQNRFSET